MYERIVVTLDGSPFAEEALAHAATMAKVFEAPIHLIRVSGNYSIERAVAAGAGYDPVAMGQLLDQDLADSRQYLSDKATELSGQGFTVTTDSPTGPVARTIIDQVKSGDLLVMSSHGRSGISRWFIGSVAESVVRESPVPVLLVRNETGGK